MTVSQQVITILMCVLGTSTTRFLPFLVFREGNPTPRIVKYFGKALPLAIFGMLVVYCLKNVSLFSGSHGLPELIGIVVTVVVHLWRKNMLMSIAGGTVCYMLLINFVF